MLFYSIIFIVIVINIGGILSLLTVFIKINFSMLLFLCKISSFFIVQCLKYIFNLKIDIIVLINFFRINLNWQYFFNFRIILLFQQSGFFEFMATIKKMMVDIVVNYMVMIIIVVKSIHFIVMK